VGSQGFALTNFGGIQSFALRNFVDPESFALTNFGTLQTNPERSGSCNEWHDCHDWEARLTSERVRVSEGPSLIRARTPLAMDICAVSMVERNLSKCFPFLILRSGLTEIRTQSCGRLRGAQITGARSPGHRSFLRGRLIIFMPLVWNLYVTLVAPTILGRHLDFWKICVSQHTHKRAGSGTFWFHKMRGIF
jgi:hypothetical protein